MIGRPNVVTRGVREQVVKPATRIAGYFDMSRISHLAIETAPARVRYLLRRAFPTVLLATGLVILGFASVQAGSATAQFQVIARVIESCKVSADAIASQAASASGTIKVNCQNRIAPASPSASAGDPVPSGAANVNYSVEEVPGSDGALKLITVNF